MVAVAAACFALAALEVVVEYLELLVAHKQSLAHTLRGYKAQCLVVVLELLEVGYLLRLELGNVAVERGYRVAYYIADISRILLAEDRFVASCDHRHWQTVAICGTHYTAVGRNICVVAIDTQSCDRLVLHHVDSHLAIVGEVDIRLGDSRMLRYGTLELCDIGLRECAAYGREALVANPLFEGAAVDKRAFAGLLDVDAYVAHRCGVDMLAGAELCPHNNCNKQHPQCAVTYIFRILAYHLLC